MGTKEVAERAARPAAPLKCASQTQKRTTKPAGPTLQPSIGERAIARLGLEWPDRSVDDILAALNA